MTSGLIAFAGLLTLIFARVPIAFAMIIVGFVGLAMLTNPTIALGLLAQSGFDGALSYELSIIPLFVLMGNLVARSKVSEELYTACNTFVGHRKGGLAMSTITACAGFSAICGSSFATASTMARVAMPSMRKYGYDDGLATGVIAAGGTLGILIPPSVVLVLYGVMTQSHIGELFIAGIIPGILGIGLYLLAVRVTIMRNPALGPSAPRRDWSERMASLKGIWPIVALFMFVIGGIYGGLFTPTEAAGVGAACALLIALVRRQLTWPKFGQIVVETTLTTASLFALLIGATLFANLINFSGMSEQLLAFVTGAGLQDWQVLLAILLIYLLLGCVMDSMGMILLTVPLFTPVIVGMDMSLIWFGIVVVVATEISLITPPVGLNVFVLKNVVRDVPIGKIFRGVTPFWIADVVRLLLITFLPALSLWLPAMSG